MSSLYRRSPLFSSGSLRAVELAVDDIPVLQLFFEANPPYFMSVTGQPPRSNEAHEEFHDKVPEGISFRKQWLLGIYDETGNMVAMAGVISDFLTEGVWHIGLFIVGTDDVPYDGGAGSAGYHLEPPARKRGERVVRRMGGAQRYPSATPIHPGMTPASINP